MSGPAQRGISGATLRWLLAAGLPSLVLGILLRNPSLDVQVELPWAHLILVAAVGAIGIVLALLVARVAIRAANARMIVLALAFYVMGLFLIVHALLTPETLVPFASTGVEIAFLAGFLLCSALLALSGLGLVQTWAQTILRLWAWLFAGASILAALTAVTGLLLPHLLTQTAGLSGDAYGGVTSGITLAASLGVAALLTVAILPYYRDYRLTGLPFHNAMVTGLLILEVASVTTAAASVWHARWWEYHVLLLTGLGIILAAVLREAARRQNLMQVFATLLVGDTVGKLERSYAEVLQILVDLVEARDTYTHGHSTRVARLAAQIGEAMGVSPEALRQLHQTALLHDVGKIAVPDVILQKPGSLTAVEFDVVITHTTIGDQLVSRIPALAFARAGIRSHHERLDGSGYPDQLRGGDISLDARIIAVADVYDAMTSARAYRPALSPEAALAELRRAAGSRYDAEVVAAFIASRTAERPLTRPAAQPAPARFAVPFPAGGGDNV